MSFKAIRGGLLEGIFVHLDYQQSFLGLFLASYLFFSFLSFPFFLKKSEWKSHF